MTNEIYKANESAKNFTWNVWEQDVEKVNSISKKHGISLVLAQIMLNRGIEKETDINNYLYPKIKELMPDPFSLKDMDVASKKIVDAILNNEKIMIYADYDVDGATSSALLKKFFYSVGHENVDIYVPCRFKEGYGPNTEAFKKIIDDGTQLIITVDCGTVSFEPVAYAKKRGAGVIIIDHHLSQKTLPDACAVVNPNRLDEEFENKNIAAVAVVFFVITAVRKSLREQGVFRDKNITEPNLIEFLDLVALGTVCDVMPLSGLNRAFVQLGLNLMNNQNNLGLNVLRNIVKLDKSLMSYHLGFVFGPRINAGGRIGKGHLGSDLLFTDSYKEAYEIALDLEKYNNERKAIESFAYDEAINNIISSGYEKNDIIITVGNGWHLGILGILASRLKEKFQKPVFVISINDNIGKGSGRSIEGIDIGTMLTISKEEGLIIDGGGHSMAGGFNVKEDMIDEFYKFLLSSVSSKKNLTNIYKNAKILNIDSIISISSVNLKLMEELSYAEPFGQGNAKPRFMIQDIKIIKFWIISQQHISFIVKDYIHDKEVKSLQCIFFKGLENKLGGELKNNLGKKVNIVGYLQKNYFDKDKVDFIIEDFAFNG